MLSEERLAELERENAERRRVKEAATPGPWERDPQWSDAVRFANGTRKLILTRLAPMDVAFLASVRSDPVEDRIDELLAEVRSLRGSHPCQVCGKHYPSNLLCDIKGSVPGGMKVTCMECVGRLEEREACAKLTEATAVCGPTAMLGDLRPDWRGTLLELAAAIRARGNKEATL